MKVDRKCEVCKKDFKIFPCFVREGKGGRFCSHVCYYESRKGEAGYWMGKKRLEMRSEKHANWKGDNASYRAKHYWIENKSGKPHNCEHCNRTDLRHRQYHWANISGEYKRIETDWIRLCSKCHAIFDGRLGKRIPQLALS